MSMPLVVDKSTGQKFGKTEAGAVWLDPAKTSSTQFYQFWVNSDDGDVESYLKIFTLLPKEQIEQVMNGHRADPAQRKAQKTLAKEVTELVHGAEPSKAATDIAQYLTSQVSITEASESDLAEIRKEIPSAVIRASSTEDLHLRHTLVDVGLAGS